MTKPRLTPTDFVTRTRPSLHPRHPLDDRLRPAFKSRASAPAKKVSPRKVSKVTLNLLDTLVLVESLSPVVGMGRPTFFNPRKVMTVYNKHTSPKNRLTLRQVTSHLSLAAKLGHCKKFSCNKGVYYGFSYQALTGRSH